MAIVTLTFIGSEEEITSGIPRFMTIESNVPATIHFTLNGVTPTINSPIYIDTFEMPDGETSVDLSAFGIDADGYFGPILTQVFSADQTQIDVTRNIGLEGIVVDRFLDPTNFIVGFDAVGEESSFSDIPRIDLKQIHSSQGRLGIAEGTQIEILVPDPEDTPYPFDDNFQSSSKVSDDFFNPLARTIINDHREDSATRVINRPWGSIRSLHRSSWGAQELRGTDSTYVSGGFVRRFYDAKNNVMGSYYFDHNEGRYVKGLQELPNIPNLVGFSSLTGMPLVFKWLPHGRHSTIPL